MSPNERDGVRSEGRLSKRVRAIVERYQDEPNRCTIFPEDASEEERLTTWITAADPFYVDLWEHR
jgi:hypothetical protein